MFRATNNKVNPSQKEKKQKRDNQEKQKRRSEAAALKLQWEIEQGLNLVFLESLFEPGKFYELQTSKNFWIKLKPKWLPSGTVVLFANVRRSTGVTGSFFSFRVIAGEEVGELLMKFEEAKKALKPVDIDRE